MIKILINEFQQNTVDHLCSTFPEDWNLSDLTQEDCSPDIILSKQTILSPTIPHLLVLPYTYQDENLKNRDNIYYSVCSLSYKNELIKKGINFNNIFVTGIPEQDFLKDVSIKRKTKTASNLLSGSDCGLPIVSYFPAHNPVTRKELDVEIKTLKNLINLCETEESFFLNIEDRFIKPYDLRSELDLNGLISKKLGRLASTENLNRKVSDIFLCSDLIISWKDNPILIEGILSNVPVLSLFSSEIGKFTEILNIPTLNYSEVSKDILDYIGVAYDFSEEQMNYILSNYLPFSFDGGNSKRITTAISFIIEYQSLVKKAKEYYYSRLSESCIEIIDPLFSS